jgi:hypothetical protein
MDGRGNERRTIRVEIVLVTALGPVQSPALLLHGTSQLPTVTAGSRWVTLIR